MQPIKIIQLYIKIGHLVGLGSKVHGSGFRAVSFPNRSVHWVSSMKLSTFEPLNFEPLNRNA